MVNKPPLIDSPHPLRKRALFRRDAWEERWRHVPESAAGGTDKPLLSSMWRFAPYCRAGALWGFPREGRPGGGTGLFSGTDLNPHLLWGCGFLCWFTALLFQFRKL